MRKKELSKKYGVDSRTLDYYSCVEKILPYKQVNESNNYREFDEVSEETLKQILILRELGYSIKKIKIMLNGTDFFTSEDLDKYIVKLKRKQMEEFKRMNKLIDYAEDMKYCLFN